jgi:hypothetical protein
MKKLFAVLALGVFTLSISSAAIADEAGSGEKSVTGFFRKLFNYPATTRERKSFFQSPKTRAPL